MPIKQMKELRVVSAISDLLIKVHKGLITLTHLKGFMLLTKKERDGAFGSEPLAEPEPLGEPFDTMKELSMVKALEIAKATLPKKRFCAPSVPTSFGKRLGEMVCGTLVKEAERLNRIGKEDQVFFTDQDLVEGIVVVQDALDNLKKRLKEEREKASGAA